VQVFQDEARRYTAFDELQLFSEEFEFHGRLHSAVFSLARFRS
jgi:hypothetical protein